MTNLVRVQLNCKDKRLGRVEREEEARLVQESTCGCVRARV